MLIGLESNLLQYKQAQPSIANGYDYKTMNLSTINSPEGKKQYLFITKTNKQGKEIQKIYQATKKLGDGCYGKVKEFTPLMLGSNLNSLREAHENCQLDNSGRKKALKIAKPEKTEDLEFAKELLINSQLILAEQLRNPKTGNPLRKVPGLITRVKYLDPDFGLALQTHYGLGDLYIHDNDKPLEIKEVLNMTSQLSFGLKHLHLENDQKPARVHRDLKNENILHRKNKDGVIEYAIADLDMALPPVNVNEYEFLREVYMHQSDANIIEGVGIPAKEQSEFNKSLDVYAFGMVLRTRITGIYIRLFIKTDCAGYCYNRTLLEVKSFPEEYQNKLEINEVAQLDGLCKLINQMTEKEWKKRPTAEGIVDCLTLLNFPVQYYPDA